MLLNILKLIINNPLIIWLVFFFKSLRIYLKNPTLKINYLSEIINSTFGKYVVLHKKSKVINSFVDDFSYLGPNTVVLNSKIGKFCCIAHNVQIGTGKHPSRNFVSSHPIFYSLLKQSQITFSDNQYFQEYAPITIGNDVWIGTNVVVMDGVNIGDGSIIASGSVITKDVEPYGVVGGIPGKLIRKRFNQQQIDFLLKDKWWDKDIKWLKDNFKLFHDIENYNQL